MMNHPASDISKVLKSKKNLKTKKNFQLKFNNIRRKNGSVGTVLGAEGNSIHSYSRNIKGNWYKVGKASLKPCSVKLTRLSQIQLIRCGYKTIAKCNHNPKGSIQLNEHYNVEATMRKGVNNKNLKSSVDKTELHLELEKVASTFASEVKEGNRFQYEDFFENPENFPATAKQKGTKPKAVRKPAKRDQTYKASEISVDNIIARNELRRQTRSSSRASSVHSETHYDASGSESDTEEWYGWNSKVTPLDVIPGAEIITVEESQHVENIINWNTTVENESDLDVEEVFLLTDLTENERKNACTESVGYSSDEDWPGWPEKKPSTPLCYIFNI